MKKQIEDVRKFHETFDHPVNKKPGIPNKETQELRVNLILEELIELEEANEEGDVVKAGDAMIDLLYVIYGALHCYGLADAAPECFDEVQSSNMSKTDENGKPIKRGDGKILKGPNYFKPDLKSIIEKHLDNKTD